MQASSGCYIGDMHRWQETMACRDAVQHRQVCKCCYFCRLCMMKLSPCIELQHVVVLQGVHGPDLHSNSKAMLTLRVS